MTAETFCAICERKLGKKDSEHVCRLCFRKAREPKETTLHLSDEGAQRLGLAYAVGNFINWGIQKLVEVSGAKLPPPPKTPKEARERDRAARANLKGLSDRIDRTLRRKGRGRRSDS